MLAISALTGQRAGRLLAGITDPEARVARSLQSRAQGDMAEAAGEKMDEAADATEEAIDDATR